MTEYCMLRQSEDYHDYSLSFNKDQILNRLLSDIKSEDIIPFLTKYPEDNNTEIKEAIRCLIPAEELLIGSGSEELIWRINRVLLLGKKVAVVVPNFYRIYESIENPVFISQPYDPVACELEMGELSGALKRFHYDAVWLANPNPITGKAYRRQELKVLVEQYPDTLFLIDEVSIDAVLEMEKYTMFEECLSYANVIVLRSFSKFYGFPGMRLGYAAGNPALISFINNHSPVYPVSNINCVIVKWITEHQDIYEAFKRRIAINKECLSDIVQNTDLYLIRSLTNTVILGSKSESSCLWNTFKGLNILTTALDRETGVIGRNLVRLTIHSDKNEFDFLSKKILNIFSSGV
ncbi:Histidinol-phosphate aminotransferase [compost metagenome]